MPDLLAIVEQVPDPVRTVLAHVTESGGEVRVPGGEPQVVEGEWPVHKVTGGGPAHLPMHERVEERWRRNAAAVAETAVATVDGADAHLLVLTGDGPARSRLRDRLPERAAAIAVEVEHTGGAAPGLPDTVAAAADEVRAQRRRAALDRFGRAAGRADGLAARGLDAVVAASRVRAVEILLVGPAASGEVWLGDEPFALGSTKKDVAALGAHPVDRVPAVPALIRAVVLADGEVVLTGDDEGPDLPGGLGALLRFPA